MPASVPLRARRREFPHCTLGGAIPAGWAAYPAQRQRIGERCLRGAQRGTAVGKGGKIVMTIRCLVFAALLLALGHGLALAQSPGIPPGDKEPLLRLEAEQRLL